MKDDRIKVEFFVNREIYDLFVVNAEDAGHDLDNIIHIAMMEYLVETGKAYFRRPIYKFVGQKPIDRFGE